MFKPNHALICIQTCLLDLGLKITNCQQLTDKKEFTHAYLTHTRTLRMSPWSFSPRYVALVSGLEMGRKDEHLLANQLLMDLLTGQLGEDEQQRATAGVVRLVVCGNSLSSATQDKDSVTKVTTRTRSSR